MSKSLRVPFLLFLVTLSFWAVGVLAQDSSLTYESQIVGELSENQPFAFYNFSGQRGDLVVARVNTFDPAMLTTLSLNAPSGRQVAFVEGGLESPILGDNFLSYQLTEDGAYTLQVGALPESPRGGFLLSFKGYSSDDFVEIPSDGFATPIAENASKQLYRFMGQENAPITLSILGSEFSAEIYDATGNFVGAMRNSPTLNAEFVIDGGEGMYSLLVFPTGETGQITISLNDDLSSESPVTESTPPPPVSTEEVSDPIDGCAVTGSGINVRSGPGIDYEIVAALNGTSRATAVTTDGWYQIELASGFVFGDVVSVSGDCSNLPVVTVSTDATVTYTPTTSDDATSTYTTTPPADVTPTYTATPPAEATTEQPTLTATPTEAVPEAPEDVNPHNWNISRTTGGTFSEVVSGPGGDNQDRIDARVDLGQSPPDNERTINHTLSCSGVGTENIRWTRQSPNAQQYRCGETINWRYAYPNSSMSYYVFFADGSPASYVNYTITATIVED